jgi:hypothetical protein
MENIKKDRIFATYLAGKKSFQMNINFDNLGHLTPYEIIEIDLTTFQDCFVSKMQNARFKP